MTKQSEQAVQASKNTSSVVGRAAAFYGVVILTMSLTIAGAISPFGQKEIDHWRQLFSRDVETGISFFEKVKSDLDLKPYYFLPIIDEKTLAAKETLSGLSFRARRADAPMIVSRDKDREDFIFVVGAFDFDDSLHGALLFNRQGDVVHQWRFEEETALKSRADHINRIIPHGAVVERDGSITATFDGAMVMTRIDACSNVMWAKEGYFHHSMTRAALQPNAYWTWDNTEVALIDGETGEIVKSLSMREIARANPHLDILGIRQIDAYDGAEEADDPYHPNDVEPLPAAYADAFPQFEAGDLLMSFRSLNLVAVVDQDTAQIKWHAIGYWRRQHDPDWAPDGTIRVYDNNMHRGASRLVSIDPQTNKYKLLVDGEKHHFYSRIRGKHQWTPEGRVIFSSPDQGRIIELDETGEVSFEFVNLYDRARDEALVVTEAQLINPDEIDMAALERCAG